jgi:hypothetical protein
MNKLTEQRLANEKALGHASYYDANDPRNQKCCYVKVSE